ncbi:MAG: hypothetical protein NW218_14035 [Saprospiraceae bacterium]|nr:hypothetical protein [Saprospiraceae bacterium]
MTNSPFKLHIFILCIGLILGCSNATIAQTIQEFGLLKSAEDSGYPLMTLQIEFPERNFSEYFTLNLEEVKSVKAQTLSNAIGKYVAFEYESEIRNALFDLYLGGTLLNEGDRPPVDPDAMHSVTGILSNAAEVTNGDLPGEIYITTEEEITVKIPYFITPEIVAANGKVVRATYEQFTSNKITALKVKK